MRTFCRSETVGGAKAHFLNLLPVAEKRRKGLSVLFKVSFKASTHPSINSPRSYDSTDYEPAEELENVIYYPVPLSELA